MRKKPSPVSGLTGLRVLPFGWYGGKFSHLDWLLPQLPECHHYCEPFGGSGAILLNREPSPVETYNDLDGEVVNFFRVLREQKDKLIEAIGLTPFSREEFAASCVLDPQATPFERARRFYVRARQVRTGLAQTASLGRWSNCKGASNGGMSNTVCRWLRGIDDLPAVAGRLLRVQIENRPATEVIALYDSPSTLFYCDPPYVADTRNGGRAYLFEMTDAQHTELLGALDRVVGRVALSGYRSEVIDSVLRPPKWRLVTHESTSHATTNSQDSRTEVLWMNYGG